MSCELHGRMLANATALMQEARVEIERLLLEKRIADLRSESLVRYIEARTGAGHPGGSLLPPDVQRAIERWRSDEEWEELTS